MPTLDSGNQCNGHLRNALYYPKSFKNSSPTSFEAECFQMHVVFLSWYGDSPCIFVDQINNIVLGARNLFVAEPVWCDSCHIGCHEHSVCNLNFDAPISILFCLFFFTSTSWYRTGQDCCIGCNALIQVHGLRTSMRAILWADVHRRMLQLTTAGIKVLPMTTQNFTSTSAHKQVVYLHSFLSV